MDISSFSSCKLLFVENHDVFARTVINAFLYDYDVTIIGRIDSAFELFQENCYDAILVDYDLDDGKGSQLVMKIRASNRQVKIIAVSSHDMGNQEILAAGGNAVCKKADFETIVEILQNEIQGDG